MKQFLDELKIFKATSFEMHEDSQPMINAQKRNVSQSRFKHMKTKHHFIRKLLFDGWCKLVKIDTKLNIADMATQILPAKTVSIFSKVVLDYRTQHKLHLIEFSLLYFLLYITLQGVTYTLQFPLSLYSDNWGVMSDTTYLIY